VDSSKQEILANDTRAPLFPLSVVVATTQPWPEIRECMASLYLQAQSAGAEIIVGDAHGHGLPDESAPFPNVIWLRLPGASVYQARALAMAQARGKIVALTEDHCRVNPDWCAKILQAHKDYPEVAVIGGAVENGATNTLIDWASFFYANGCAMPPLGTKVSRQLLQLNLSYKQRVVPKTTPELGRMEHMLNQALREQGETLLVDDRIVQYHVQSLGFPGTCLLHYHGSKSVSGFRLEHIGSLERGIRIAACFAMPPVLFARALLPLLGKHRLRGKIIMALPALALLVCIRAVGAFAGLVAGPGESPKKVR
jgi:glycosyl transferase family 2